MDVLVSTRRDGPAARRFFTRALEFGIAPSEIMTDRAPVYPRVLDEMTPAARRLTEQYANSAVEADTAGSKTGYGPCVDSNGWRRRAPSQLAMPSCRTCDEGTTSSARTCRYTTESASRSTSWL
jgi:transposase-like protein